MFYDFSYLAKGFRMRPKVRSTLRKDSDFSFFFERQWLSFLSVDVSK